MTQPMPPEGDVTQHHHGHHASHVEMAPHDTAHYREAKRSTWASVWVNLVLMVMQIFVGFWAHSQALVADGIHSLSDLLCDALVLFANRRGAEPPDSEHPYGHGRIETASSFALGVALVVTGGGLLWFAALRLQQVGDLPPVLPAAFWMALLTLLGKELLFRYMISVGQRLRSPMLIANAWHARSDAASSLVVAVGIGGSLAGYLFADSLAAALVGYMIVRIGLKFSWVALQELIDTGLSEEATRAIHECLEQAPGVRGVHDLRTRFMGRHVLVDVHVEVDSRISVSEGHYIAEAARAQVLKTHTEVLDVLVHIDSEPDVTPVHTAALPGRESLQDELRSLLPTDLPAPSKIVLHYLQGQVEAEVLFQAPKPGSETTAQTLCERLLTVETELGKQLSTRPHWRSLKLRLG